jgi:hypothetical protein
MPAVPIYRGANYVVFANDKAPHKVVFDSY